MTQRFRYSAWDGTQSVADLDADDLLGELADDVITHGDLEAALRRMLRDGFTTPDGDRVDGLRELLERLAERRRELLERYDPDGVIDDVRRRLDEIVADETQATERAMRAADGDERDRLAQQLDDLHRMPEDPASRMRGLQSHDFNDPGARQRFDELLDELRSQVMDRISSQMRDAMTDTSPERMQATKDMMADLNRMLRDRAEGREPDFDGFMERHGEFFPENPRSLDELLEQLARRMLQTQQLLNSMSPEQRAEMEALMQAMLDDVDLAWEAAELGRLLADAMPSLPWEQGWDFSGSDPLDLPGATSAMDALARMDELSSFAQQATSPAMLAEIDPSEVGDLLGEDAERSLRRLQQMTKALEDAGLVQRTEGRLELTAKGLRSVGRKALAELFGKLERDRFGDHTTQYRGSLGEPLYTTRPYEFGDPFLLDVGRTIRNAVFRNGPSTPVGILPEDFEITETERRTRTSTVLLLDLSLSMPMRGNFLAAKKVAMALQALITSRFPRDHLGLVGFGEVARTIEAKDLPSASYDYAYGTNMQHAFMLARQMLARERAATKQIIMITDGEPTSHLEGDVPVFNYPPVRATIEATLTEVVRCTRDDITINTFMLDATPALRHFVERITEINGGRAFFTTPETLGEFVLVDFLEHKRRQRRA